MEVLKKLLVAIWNLTADQLALISLLVTFLIFIINKSKENKLKIYETRKEEYKKLLSLFQKMFSGIDDTSKLLKDKNVKQLFIDVGTSLAVFGSKKLYKTYCFYRRLSNDEHLQKTKWYSNEMIIFTLGEMYQIMRREIGLNRDFISLDVPEVLSFVLNDITKPDYKKKYYQYHFNKLVLKTIIFWGKIDSHLPLCWVWNYIVKPLFFFIWMIIYIPIRLLILTPYRAIKNRKVT